MKEIIEKAIDMGNFLELQEEQILFVERKRQGYHPTFPKRLETQIWKYTKEETAKYAIVGVWSGSLADLIFTTNLLECLVGDRPECKYRERYEHAGGGSACTLNNYRATCTPNCTIDGTDGWKPPDYHKQQLVIRPPDQWVDYLRGLI